MAISMSNSVRKALLLAYWGFACFQAGAAPLRTVRGENLEHFKAFLSDPGYVEHVVFSTIGVASAAGANQMHLYGRWQSNAFVIREITSPQTENRIWTNGILAWGSYQPKYWTKAAGVIREWINNGTENPQSNPVYAGTKLGRMLLGRALMFGIRDVTIGTLKWEGDRFVATSFAISNVTVRGKIDLNSDSLVSISLSYNEFKYLIEYEFAENPDLPAFAPSKATTYFLDRYGRSRIDEIRYASLELTNRPLEPLCFEPTGPTFQTVADQKILIGSAGRMVTTTQRVEQLVVYTNNAAFGVIDGQFTPYPKDQFSKRKRFFWIFPRFWDW
jgi:hypothetical protein